MMKSVLSRSLLILSLLAVSIVTMAQENDTVYTRPQGLPASGTGAPVGVDLKIEVKVDSAHRGQLTDAEIAHAVEEGIRRAFGQPAQGGVIYMRPGANANVNEAGVRMASLYDRYMEKQQMRGRRLQRVDRDALKAVFIPKGQWMLGGSVNFQEWDTDNINLLVLKNMDVEGHIFSASPYFGYFVANNIAIGARYNYLRNYFYMGNFDLNLGEDFNISLEDLYYLEHKHEASAFLRTYMPLGKSNVFGFFGEIRGTYAYANGKNSTGSGAEFDGSYEHVHSLQLSFCPGMTAFVTDFMAVEASIGVMGLKYRWKDQKTNQVEKGSSKMGGANFKFNLFSVNLGMTFYL